MHKTGARHRWSAAVYRTLMKALPRSISGAHGEEMLQAFRSSLRDATTRDGLRGFALTWVSSLVDVARSALYGHVDLRRSRRAARTRAQRLEGVSSPPPSLWTALFQGLPADARLAFRRL